MDETTQNTRKIILMLLVGFVAFFAIAVLVWYFFFKPAAENATPTANPGLPFSDNIRNRFNFIFNNPDDTPNNTSETEVTKRQEQPLVEIWHQPTTGNTFVTSNHLEEYFSTTTPRKTKTNPNPTPVLVRSLRTATTSAIFFVDRTTGYIYGYNKLSDTTYQISNTTIPGIYDAYIFKNGERILFRYLDEDKQTIISMIAEIPQVKEGDGALPLINQTLLPKNVISVAVSEITGEASYVVPNSSGSSFYTILDQAPSLTASSPFSEWNIHYSGSKLFATTKPSAYITGSTVAIPSFSRVENDKTGLLSLLAPDGASLHSMWSNSGLVLYFLRRGSTIISDSKTLASKCVWQHTTTSALCGVPTSLPQEEEGLPDDWYQGRVLFTDSLKYIDSNTGQSYPLFTFEDKIPQMDVTKLALSEDDIDVLFIRKQNGSLWLLKTNLITSGE
jgi:hypothetical protein